ncbi:hypothetical protein NMR75_003846 [Vibrio cholerae]|nr:hypothetical protein [Vibrio cholerae]
MSKINDWIKYAEAKNAANIAFCSASIFGVSRLALAQEELPMSIAYYSIMVVVLLMLSIVMSFMSFIPRLKSPWVFIGERSDSDNLLYFGDACKYSGVSYLKKLYEGKDGTSENYSIELMYANQIVVNSKVAYMKFKSFDVAVMFTISSVVTPIGACLLYCLRD